MANRGSRASALAFTVVSAVVKITSSPSTRNQVGVTCGLPLALVTASFPVRVPVNTNWSHCSLDIDRMSSTYHGHMARTNFAELNSTIRYTMWSVFRVDPERLPDDRGPMGTEARNYLDALDGKGVVVRGAYDLAGLR